MYILTYPMSNKHFLNLQWNISAHILLSVFYIRNCEAPLWPNKIKQQVPVIFNAIYKHFQSEYGILSRAHCRSNSDFAFPSLTECSEYITLYSLKKSEFYL